MYSKHIGKHHSHLTEPKKSLSVGSVASFYFQSILDMGSARQFFSLELGDLSHSMPLLAFTNSECRSEGVIKRRSLVYTVLRVTVSVNAKLFSCIP